ncbi:hypothetical protein WA158_006428 [Blastocystis sp. Blastoise]
MQNLYKLCFILFALINVIAVDQNKFRKCSQAGFCSRHRAKPTINQYSVDPLSIVESENRVNLQLIPSREQTTTLTMGITFVSQDTIRVRVTETNPLNNKPRYEPDYILQEESLVPVEYKTKEKNNDYIIVESINKESSLKIQYTPFLLEYYVQNNLKISINNKNLFYFEVTRQREIPKPIESNTQDNHGETEQQEIEVKSNAEKTIVDYNEAGQPIYDDGTIGESPKVENNQGENEIKTENTSENPETAVIQEEKEDETGYWNESFGGNTDSKPFGPQSIGCDITFHDVNYIYGLPEHAANVLLETTAGDNPHFTEPYRMFNLDVFEYETDKPMALYGSIPLLVGTGVSGTAGVLFFNPTDTYVDVYNSVNNSISTQWMSEAGIFDLFFFKGPSPSSLLSQYISITGKPQLPPYFSLGYHQSRWNYRDETDIHEVDMKFEELNFPYDVLWLDIEHTNGKKYFTWDDNSFPNPDTMIKQLADKGHKLVTIIDPHVKKEEGYSVYTEIKSHNYAISTSSSSLYEGWCWPGTSIYPDFTDKQVRDFWGTFYKPSFYRGSCDNLYTWNDMNEPSVFNGPEVTMPRDNLNRNGYEHRAWHNVYGIYYHMANYYGHLTRSPNQRPFILTRSFFAGSQRFGAHWIGDTMSNWDHMRNMVPMLLGNGLAGFSFGGADIPGFFKNPESEELVYRWYQYAAFTPFLRAHAHIDTKRREPWLFEDSTYKRIRDSVVLRYTYLPYLYTLFYDSHIHGYPVIRPLFYHYPQDIHSYEVQYSYLIGEDLMLIGVTQPQITTVTEYIPSGQWYELNEQKIYIGGQKITFNVSPDYMPLLQRAGSIIPRQMRLRRSASQTINDPFTLNIVLDMNQSARGDVYLDDRDGFGYEQGQYAYIHYELNNGVLISKRISGNDDYSVSNTIERIVIYSNTIPSYIELTVDGSLQSLEFSYDNVHHVITIRKPNVHITDNWAIKMI